MSNKTDKEIEQACLYAIGTYGDMETAFKAMSTIYFKEHTGIGENRNPLLVSDLTKYTPPIKRKNNESLGDYKVRQLDYWLKHTKLVKRSWWERIKITILPAEKLTWVKK